MSEKNQTHVEALANDLHNGSKAKKFEALQVIRKEKYREILPELRALFDRERSLDIQREILKAFADIGGDLAIEGLLDALHGHEPGLRLEAARRLSRIKPEEAKEAFLRILEGEEWDLIRLILPSFDPPYGTKEDIPALFSVIQRAPNPTIKYLATRCMNLIEES